jgi:hypothetical protein
MNASLLKKYWPSILHAAGILIIFMDPAVKNATIGHPAWSVPILLAWGWALHWATAPKNADTVAAVKVIETPPQSVENVAAEKAIQKAEDSAK